MKPVSFNNPIFIRVLLIFILSSTLIIRAGAQMQFSVTEITELFNKQESEIFDFLNGRDYEYSGKEVGLSKFRKHTLLGDYTLSMSFKNSKLDAIRHDELAARGSLLIQDLDNCGFVFSDKNIDSGGQGLYIGCFYRFDNSQLGLMCTINRTPDNENALSVVFGKIPLSISKIFQGFKKFHNEENTWIYKVTIKGNLILLKSYAGKNNSTYSDKMKVHSQYSGTIKNGRIIIDWKKSEFRYENNKLYEINNEGSWNEYSEF